MAVAERLNVSEPLFGSLIALPPMSALQIPGRYLFEKMS